MTYDELIGMISDLEVAMIQSPLLCLEAEWCQEVGFIATLATQDCAYATATGPSFAEAVVAALRDYQNAKRGSATE